ncbi:DEAD/DEAH box helicase [Psychromonas sp. SP041]|uniref:DEAD/DEAH box helicase n=1 Tax=Psychromonas sp. SP041 TaxID=1365007 RepID=UPI0010C7BE8B|nr:DEAD/DEAH box helicase [Psychromonas sp. SP041]
MSDELFSSRFLNSMKKLGIESIDELLLYLPDKYKDFRMPDPKGIASAKESGKKTYLKLKLVRNPEIEVARGKPGRVKLQLTDGIINASAMIFGGTQEWTRYKAGDLVFVTATYSEYNDWPQLQKIDLIPPHHQGRIVPFYLGKKGVVSPITVGEKVAIALRSNIKKTVSGVCKKIGATEQNIIENASPDMSSISQILYALHRPKSITEVEVASKAVRMINAYHAILMSMTKKDKKPIPRSKIEYSVDAIKAQLSNLPFELTHDQKSAIWDVTKDLKAEMPMNRLLSGDVGCGKTLSYAIPAVCSYLAGKNVTIMMPNMLLAVQVANEIEESFPDADVTLILGGSKRIKGKLGKKTIIVGTTAILFWLKDIDYKYKTDLLIIDEQQKLGQNQKNILISKHTNVLEATATAIPKTVAAVVYGNKKISLIEECPVEKEIKTIVTGSDQRQAVFDKLIAITETGAQVAVLYPLRKSDLTQFDLYIPYGFEHASGLTEMALVDIINESDSEYLSSGDINLDEYSEDLSIERGGRLLRYRSTSAKNKKLIGKLAEYESFGLICIGESGNSEEAEKCKRSVESAAKHWEKYFPGQVVMIHGGLTTKEKIDAIETAKSGQCKVIVTSSVIEIGLTMPDLRGLLILESDNYGASTLHQFRGRLARKGGKGLFIMSVNCPMSELSEESAARLSLLVKYNKGSLIAENNMKQKGFGDLSGATAKQAGFFDGIFKGIKMTPQDVDELLLNSISNK